MTDPEKLQREMARQVDDLFAIRYMPDTAQSLEELSSDTQDDTFPKAVAHDHGFSDDDGQDTMFYIRPANRMKP